VWTTEREWCGHGGVFNCQVVDPSYGNGSSNHDIIPQYMKKAKKTATVTGYHQPTIGEFYLN